VANFFGPLAQNRFRLFSLGAPTLLCAVFLLAGCGGGPPKPTPTLVSVSAGDRVNLHEGQSRPTLVKVFVLKRADAFVASDPRALGRDAEKALGGDLLMPAEHVIAPASTYVFKVELDGQAKFVGVAGFFRDGDSAQWRQVVELTKRTRKKKNGVVRLNFHLDGSRVIFDGE
jgi:type VI secretion system VasD/TssJ family lipoprotein